MWIKDVQTHEEPALARRAAYRWRTGTSICSPSTPINCGLATAGSEDGILPEATVRIDLPSRSGHQCRSARVLQSTYLYPFGRRTSSGDLDRSPVTPIPGRAVHLQPPSSDRATRSACRTPVFHHCRTLGDKGSQTASCGPVPTPAIHRRLRCHILILRTGSSAGCGGPPQ